MSQAAALFITAQQNAANATTACAKNYHLGQRDAFEAIFRACFGLEEDDVTAVARDILAALPREERETLMDSARDVLRARRRVTREESLKVV
jgi:hypothetical protein